jgi:hypothetical protein
MPELLSSKTLARACFSQLGSPVLLLGVWLDPDFDHNPMVWPVDCFSFLTHPPARVSPHGL